MEKKHIKSTQRYFYLTREIPTQKRIEREYLKSLLDQYISSGGVIVKITAEDVANRHVWFKNLKEQSLESWKVALKKRRQIVI